MKVYYQNKSLQKHIKNIKGQQSIGFVPTMGALHEGHLSLIKKAKSQNEIVVVSIFVNPTQFDKKEDLTKYPRTLKNDIKLLKSVNCDILYAPTAEEIYQDNIQSESFNFDGLEFEMEGKHRKGHFNGVGTIVKRLFELVNPDAAYFGEKDFQQLQIIKKLVSKHALPVKIIGCSIFREDDGLAMSSRNVRLSELHRKEAPFIYKTLQLARTQFHKKSIPQLSKWVENEFSKNKKLRLEYFEIANINNLKTAKRKSKNKQYRGFIAVFAGKVRLIDNIALN